ncbi:MULTISPECIES: hypothetical protein [unclassified Aureimonas]|uniref:hypothetical protein n=1 Tax=unclassified Aureimonas TaxID=2615206 RepID=UPI0006F95206|nr:MULTISPECIES: hypothetical protein [unclassified Aureimonas]KQT69633.1 hypothetical protein ASG62_00385 [Aureimonas sp. Leaf427]KQT76213.1 hypothetical protein ASG54_15830 [Aureimonas sp. Leaf460]
MLTVLIEAGDDAPALGTSLASLVSGAVEGLVREVVVLDVGMDAGTRKVADHAGCRVAPAADLSAVVAAAKGDWLLLIEAGSRLSSDWIEDVTVHLSEVERGTRTPHAARFSRSTQDRPSFLARLRQKRTALTEGLLLPKAQAVGLSKSAASIEAMAKGVATTRLNAAIRVAARSG